MRSSSIAAAPLQVLMFTARYLIGVYDRAKESVHLLSVPSGICTMRRQVVGMHGASSEVTSKVRASETKEIERGCAAHVTYSDVRFHRALRPTWSLPLVVLRHSGRCVLGCFVEDNAFFRLLI